MSIPVALTVKTIVSPSVTDVVPTPATVCVIVYPGESPPSIRPPPRPITLNSLLPILKADPRLFDNSPLALNESVSVALPFLSITLSLAVAG